MSLPSSGLERAALVAAVRTIGYSRSMRRRIFVFLLAFTALCVSLPARAEYPSRPVTLIVAFTPGGPSDLLARILGKKLEQLLGQPFVIENRPGAGGNIAAEVAAHAPPDGYTLLMGNNSILATNASLYRKIGYDAERDFAPVSLIGSQANILVVNSALPVRSLGELIALAKQKPGQLNFASSGYGAAAHLSGELFKAQAGIDILHVAYKGAAPALQDVIGGHVQMMFATAASVVGHVKDGLVRPLAVTTLKRTAVLPNVQTVAEAGVANYEASLLFGLIAPPGLPPAVLAKINAEVVRIIKAPEMQKKLAAQGVLPIASAPDAFVGVIKAEQGKWAQVIKAANIKE